MMRQKIMALAVIGMILSSLTLAAAYSEAPSLAARVAAGELPPVEERLPENPLVLEPVARIGQYGGDWRMGLVGGADTPWLIRTIGYENLVNWDVPWTGVVPNIAESYEVSDDATEYTFHLREGMRWSDGEPFTADDIMFWYEDVLLNKELTPGIPSWLMSGDEPVVVEKIDDYTVVFRFAEPNGLFLNNLALPTNGGVITMYPRHYLEQFHSSYNTETLDSLVQREGVADWVMLFQNKSDIHRYSNSDKPVLFAWMLTTAYGQGTRVVAERNPYYWKVDTEGNQLPYIDRAIYDIFENAEVLLLRALAGEIDMYDRHLTTLANRAVLTDYQEEGSYSFYELIPAGANAMVFFLNLTHNDPVKREIFQNKDFRIGLSHALNRQEIIDLVYLGQGEPFQVAPRRGTDLYDEEMAKQYTEYNVELANEYLDRAFPERDAQGFRLGPDGNRIAFVVEVTAAIQPWVDAIELVQEAWRDVGVDMQPYIGDRSLIWERMQANQQDAMVWGGEGGLPIDAMMGPYSYFPFDIFSKFAATWSNWYQGLSNAEEPPTEVQRQMELYDELVITADPERQLELMRQILEIAKDQFYHIGITTQPSGYGLVKNNFLNVPASMPQAGLYPNPAPTNPAQYFIGD